MRQKKWPKKFMSLVLVCCLIATLVSASIASADEVSAAEQDLSGETTFVFDGDSVTVMDGNDSNYEVVIYNYLDTESTPSVSSDEDGNTVYSLPEGSTGQILVSIKKKGGSYVFRGTGNGSIAVKKQATNDAILYLDGLNLTSSFTAPITVKKESSAACMIYAVEGSENILTDAEYNYEPDADETATDNLAAENAVIKCKDSSDVTITGGGIITINANAKNGIKANNLLTIDGNVTLDITSVDNGINSENSIAINSGNITIETQEGDGIKASSDAGDIGDITISGGTINIQAGGDGIQAAQDLTITDGDFTITTGSGYDDSSFDKDTMSYKGLKASAGSDDTSDTTNTIDISGGSFSLNTADDAIHSDGYIVISGGTFDIKTGDDGVHADTSLTLGTENSTDDMLVDITVSESYEGLEAGNVYIYSGTYSVTASDDGINAAGGSGNGTDSSWNDRFNPGGGPGGWNNNQNHNSSAESYSLNIYGGSIYVNAENGDGLDSNGSLNLTGGTIIVWGAAAGSDNEPLDCDGTLLINGATVFAAGSSGMVTSPSNDSQKYVTYGRTNSGGFFGGGSSSSTIARGKTINVQYNGTTVYNIKAVKNVSYVLYSSPNMESSTNWSITADDSALLEDETSPTETPTPIYVESIAINGLSDSMLSVGDTVQLSAVINPSDATNTAVVWSSGNKAAATVNSEGLVTAVGAGTATITATAADGSGAAASVSVTVDKKVSEIENVAINATATAAYTNVYENVTEAAINDGALATTDTSTCWNSWGASDDYYPMTVTLTWDKAQILESMEVLWWIYTDTGVVYPDYATVQYLDSESGEWIDIGTVTGDGEGICDENTIWNKLIFDEAITTTALRMLIYRPDSASDPQGVGISEWRVYGQDAEEKSTETLVESITLNGISDSELSIGSTVQLSAAVSPADAADTAVIWHSSNEAVATVDVNGLVTAMAAGTATIFATANDGSGAAASVKITVTEEEPVITVTPTATPTVTPTVTPTAAPTAIPTAVPTIAPSVHVGHVGQTFVVNGLKYKVTKDDASGREVRVTSMKVKTPTLKIPAKVTNSSWGESFKVTSIKAKAFKGTAITKVTIGKNVTKIGPNAFLNCKKLKTVIIGKSVKTIGIRTFYGCSKLTKVTIKSANLNKVNKNAFKRISRKAVIKVPTGKKAAYKKQLKGKIAKGVTIK